MPSIFAALALLGLTGLAFSPAAKPSPADGVTLIALALALAVALLPALHRRLAGSPDAATFVLLTATFVVYQLADRVGPARGWALHFSVLPDDRFPITYALRLSLAGALLGAPAWWRSGGPERFVLAALVVVGTIGAGSFWLLSRFYPMGVTEALDPTPMPSLYLQLLGYGCLALTCRAAMLSEPVRRWSLRLAPALLFLLWCKHTLLAPKVEADE